MPTVSEILRKRTNLMPQNAMGLTRKQILSNQGGNRRGFWGSDQTVVIEDLLPEGSATDIPLGPWTGPQPGGYGGSIPNWMDELGEGLPNEPPGGWNTPGYGGGGYGEDVYGGGGYGGMPPDTYNYNQGPGDYYSDYNDYGGISTGAPTPSTVPTASKAARGYWGEPKPTEVAKSIYDIGRQRMATTGRAPSINEMTGIVRGVLEAGTAGKLGYEQLKLSYAQLDAQIQQWQKQLQTETAQAEAQGTAALFGTIGAIGGYLLPPPFGGPVGGMIGGVAGGILSGLF